MVQLSSKTFIAVFAVVIAVTIIIVTGLFLGWFEPLAGIGGPFAAGLFEILAVLPRWVVTGWPQMGAGILLIVASWIAFGYIFEEKQVIATLRGSSQPSSSGYTNTMAAEPQEPEPAPQPTPQSS